MKKFSEFISEASMVTEGHYYEFKKDSDADDVAMELNTLGIEWKADDWSINGKTIETENGAVDDELVSIFKKLKLKPKKS